MFDNFLKWFPKKLEGFNQYPQKTKWLILGRAA